MSKTNKEKKCDDKLKQSKMGDFFSKKDSGKPKTTEKKRKATDSPSSSMWSSFWTRGAYRDTEEYRNRYPGKKDHEKWDENYQFYMNQIPSKPDGDFIDGIHAKWYGDYKKLEIHHGYIQWLFPIRDTGMNWHAQELQLHEIEKLTKNKTAKKRILTSYKMMLDFYGMVLKNEANGEIERAENWKARFKHLNSSYHNYLRITRILKSLGEFDFEHLKANFVKFVLHEGIVEQTLTNLIDSCVKYWIGVLRDDKERESVLDYYEELMEKQKTCSGKTKKTASASPENVIKVKHGPSRYVTKYDSESDSDQDATMVQYDKMDLLADTLPFENDDSEGEGKENTEKGGNKDKVSGAKRKGNLRVLHDMSDSEPEDFQTPDADESQEAGYWKRNGKTKDGEDKEEEEEAEEERNREIRDFMMGENGDRDQGKGQKDNAGKSVTGQSGDTENIEKEKVSYKRVKSANDDVCSDEIDDVISSKDKTVKKTENKSDNNAEKEVQDTEKTVQETCDKETMDKDSKTKEEEQMGVDGVPVEGSGNDNDKSAVDDEEPMETGDDGNVNV